MLVALALAAVTAFTVCTSILTALRAEQAAGQFRAVAFLCHVIDARQVLGLDGPAGQEEALDIRREEPRPGAWRTWRVSSRERPSLFAVVAVGAER